MTQGMTGATASQSPTRQRRLRWRPEFALLVLMVLSAWAILEAGQGTVFRGDDWDLLLSRQAFSFDSYLQPHVSHLIAVQIAVQNAIVALVGPEQAIMRVALLLATLAVAALLFVFARERVGPWPAVALVAPLLFLGTGSDSLIWPTQLGVVLSLALGIAALLTVDRPSTRARIASLILLLISVGAGSDGLFFTVGIGIWLSVARRWRDLWVPGVPLAVFLAWSAKYGTQSGGNPFGQAPGFFVDSVAAGISAITGFGFTLGQPLAVALLACLLLATAILVLARRRQLEWGAATAGIVAMPLMSSAALALTRAEGGDPYASRYMYPGTVLLLLAVAELLRSKAVREYFAGPPAVLVLGLSAVFVAFNLHVLDQAGNDARVQADWIRGRIKAIEVAGQSAPPDLVLTPAQDMGNTTAGGYLSSLDDFGESPVGRFTMSEVSEEGRQFADLQLFEAGTIDFRRDHRRKGSGAIPQIDLPDAPVRRLGGCLVGEASVNTQVTVPSGGLLVIPGPRTNLTILLRRYASEYAPAPGQPSAPGEIVREETLILPSEATAQLPPWHAQLGGSGPIRLCGARR